MMVQPSMMAALLASSVPGGPLVWFAVTDTLPSCWSPATAASSSSQAGSHSSVGFSRACVGACWQFRQCFVLVLIFCCRLLSLLSLLLFLLLLLLLLLLSLLLFLV